MTGGDLPSWRDAAAMGSVDELVAWAARDHHVDLTDCELVLTLAANGITNGVWRNNSEIENIHAGHYKRPGMKEPRGLRDAEMMVGNIETSRIVRKHLAAGEEWWVVDLQDELFDYDRPYAGTPLSEHVTKRVLKENSRQVGHNLNIQLAVEDLVGWDRYLLAAALIGLSHEHVGTPMWDSTIDSWLERTDSRPADDMVASLRTDPTVVDLDTIQDALHSGLWGSARGRARWHQDQCGDPAHRLSGGLASFLGPFHTIVGVPMVWQYAAGARAMERAQRGS